MSAYLNNHLTREDMHRNHYFDETSTCAVPPPTLVDQWLLPATLVCSLVCGVILVVDLTLRAHAIRKGGNAHGRRRNASALGEYSIDDFECLDTGTANMLLHLQTECNDISAKIDRCAMALVSGSRCSMPDSARGDQQTTEPEELALSQGELYEQWDNLRWFQQFVGIHMRNAFRYQQYHTQLEQVGASLEDGLRRLKGLLLHTGPATPGNGMEELGISLTSLTAATFTLNGLLLHSTQLVPLHRRVKFTGRQEALPVRALCDYQKDEFSTSLGEELKLVWRKNKYTWRVRNSHGVEGDLPALCCLIPGPDPDSMTHAQSLAEDFRAQWQAYERRCEKKLALHVCTALTLISLQDSPLVVLTDTNRTQARHTLSLVERVMTSDTFHHVISAQDRKSSQSVLHQLYELLNGRSAREETAAFLMELQRCYSIIQTFDKQVDIVGDVAKKAQTLGMHVAEARGRKKTLSRQSSFQEAMEKTLSSDHLETSETQHKIQRSTRQDHDVADDIIIALAAASTTNQTTKPSSLAAVNETKPHDSQRLYSRRSVTPNYNNIGSQSPELHDNSPTSVRHWVDTRDSHKNDDQLFSSAGKPTLRPTIKGLGEPSPPSSDLARQITTPTPMAQSDPNRSMISSPPDVREDLSQGGLRKRSTILAANATTGPGRPRTLNIAARTASFTSSASFGSPTLEVSSSDGRSLSPQIFGIETDDEKLRGGTMQRSASVSSNLSAFGSTSKTSIIRKTHSRVDVRTDKFKYSSNLEHVRSNRPDSGPSMSSSISGAVYILRSSGNESISNSPQNEARTNTPTKNCRTESRKVFNQNKKPRQSTKDDRDVLQQEQSVSSNVASTPQTPVSPEYFSCTSSPHSASSSFSQDVSLSLSLPSDEESEGHHSSACTPHLLSTRFQDATYTTEISTGAVSTESIAAGVPCTDSSVPTVTVLWSDEHSTSLSSFVAFRKDAKQTLSIRSIKDRETEREVPVTEAIKSGIIDIDRGLYMGGSTMQGSSITLTEAIMSGRILLQASVSISEIDNEMTSSPSEIMTRKSNIVKQQDYISHNKTTNDNAANAEPSTPVCVEITTSVDDNKCNPLQLARDEIVIPKLVDIPVSLMKVTLKRSSQPYLIRQVVDPRTKLIVSVQSAVQDGILIQSSGHYRNPNTGEQLVLDDAFARGLLIVDYQKACTSDNDVSLVYRGKEGVVLTRLIAVFWVRLPSDGSQVGLHEAVQRNVVDTASGVYRCDDQEIPLAEAVVQGFIKATVLDNSDLESLIRKLSSKCDTIPI